MLDVVSETLEGLVLKSVPKDDTLEASLDAYTKPNLVKLAELNDFEVKQSWNKNQMIEVISKGLRDSLDERLSTFEGEHLAVLQELQAVNTETFEANSQVVSSAVSKDLLYVSLSDDELIVTMPAEFAEKVANEEPAELEEEAAEVVSEPVKKVPFTSRPRRVQAVQQRIVGKKLDVTNHAHVGVERNTKNAVGEKIKEKNLPLTSKSKI